MAQERLPITFEDTALTLFAKMTVAAQELMREAYPLLRAGTAPALPRTTARLPITAAAPRRTAASTGGIRPCTPIIWCGP